MSKAIKKKKVIVYCTKVLSDALLNSLGKNYNVTVGNVLADIKTFKPNVIIFDNNVESILKYATKKTSVFFLSSGLVFSGVSELGFQSKDLPNNTSKEGLMLGNEENLVKEREKYLIMRLSTLYDKKWLDLIVEDIKAKKQ